MDTTAQVGALPIDADERSRDELEHALVEANEMIDNLRVALTTSRTIGAAVGIVMIDRQLGQEPAFQYLREVSQAHHRKLREIAEDVVRTGVVPTL